MIGKQGMTCRTHGHKNNMTCRWERDAKKDFTTLISIVVLEYFAYFVMINFMCQLAWVKRCTDSWLNFISKYVCEVFLDEISIWTDRRVKQIAFPSVGGPHETTECLPWIKVWVSKDSLLAFWFGHQSSWASDLDGNLYH